MTNKKNKLVLFTLLLLTIIVSVLLIKYSIIDTSKILLQGNDFQYNVISMSAIIGGFLFTGISILISAIDKPRIKRLWEHNYLDNLYRSSFIGMFSNVITIITAFILLCCCVNDKLQSVFIYIEVVTFIIGIVFFMYCIKHLIFIVKRMKTD